MTCNRMIWDNLSLSRSPGQASIVLARSSAGMPVAPVAVQLQLHLAELSADSEFPRYSTLN